MYQITIPGEPQEIWEDIKNFEGIYQISNLGKVKSLSRKVKQSNGTVIATKTAILKSCKDGRGYYFVKTSVNAKKKIVKIHRQVALCFIPNPGNKPQVNHKDGDKNNNRITNLEWVTGKENVNHSVENGLHKSGEDVCNSKLTNKQVREIRSLYIRGSYEFGAKPLARIYRVSGTTIRNIVKLKKWRCVA